MEHPSSHEIKYYYGEVQKNIADFRDIRGKKHELAMAITCFFFSLLSAPEKNNFSSVYRRVRSGYASISAAAVGSPQKPVSHSQLKRLLQGLGEHRIEELAAKLPGAPAAIKKGLWEALDGKELRGSIDGASGAKRGETVVLSVSHDGLRSEVVGFYNGAKESEKSVILKMFIDKKDNFGSYTFDALHTSASLLKLINGGGGRYLAPVKHNQPLLWEDCRHTENTLPPLFECVSEELGHGRVEIRRAFFYILPETMLEKRWRGSGIATLMVLDRYRLDKKTKKWSSEKSYHVSNIAFSTVVGKELFDASRGHWAVENHNNARDTVFKEDGLKCKNRDRCRAFACFVNSALNLLKNNCIKLKVFLEDLMFDKSLINILFKSINFS